MHNRIPAYFQLDKYNVSSEDVVRLVLQCDPSSIQPKVIVTPTWGPEVMAEAAENILEITPRKVYRIEYRKQAFSLIRSGMGAPQTGDVVLALGCTPCETIIFTGSAGGLSSDIHTGDLVTVNESICGDGFCRYLNEEIIPEDCLLKPVRPDQDLTVRLKNGVDKVCGKTEARHHHGRVFSLDSVIAEMFRLEYIAGELQCLAVEMETAAVFEAARIVGIKAGALLHISDSPLHHKSLYSDHMKKEKERLMSLRQTILAKTILDTLIS